MKAYYLVLLLSLIIQWVLPSNTDKQYRWNLFFTFLPLFIFGAIRVDFGLDYEAYERIFEAFHNITSFQQSESMSVEVGFQLLNYAMPSYRFLLVLNALLLSLALGVFCYNYVPKQYLFLAIILIYLNPEKNIYGSLVGIRNGLVVTSFLLGFIFFHKRKLLRFVILTALLSTIHRSAVLFLPIAYIVSWNKPMTKSEVYFWIVLFFVLVALGTSGIGNILDVFLSNDFLDRYEGYANRGVASGFLMVVSSLSFLLGFIYYMYHNRKDLVKKDNAIMRMGMLYLVTNVMGSLAMRAAYFYDMFFIASVVMIVSNKKMDDALRFAMGGLAIVVSFYSMFYVWMGKASFPHAIYHSLLGNW